MSPPPGNRKKSIEHDAYIPKMWDGVRGWSFDGLWMFLIICGEIGCKLLLV